MTWLKTTAHFPQNNTSLSIKRRVVFEAPAAAKTNSTEQQKLSTHHPHVTKCKKVVKYPLSRARVCSHYRSFCLFAVTSVTGHPPILLCSNTLRPHLEQILTDKRFNHSTSAYRNNEKHFFVLSSYWVSPSFSSPFPSLCDTCDSKKN